MKEDDEGLAPGRGVSGHSLEPRPPAAATGRGLRRDRVRGEHSPCSPHTGQPVTGVKQEDNGRTSSGKGAQMAPAWTCTRGLNRGSERPGLGLGFSIRGGKGGAQVCSGAAVDI